MLSSPYVHVYYSRKLDIPSMLQRRITQIVILIYFTLLFKNKELSPQESQDGQILFEVEMYLQKGCIIVSGVEASYRVFPSNKQKGN